MTLAIKQDNRKVLTAKQKDFCKSYLENKGNATKAVLENYETTNNASARAIGSENLTKPNIQQSNKKKSSLVARRRIELLFQA